MKRIWTGKPVLTEACSENPQPRRSYRRRHGALHVFEKGTVVPAHIHPQANETAFILEGEWDESGTTYSSGTLFYAPQGEPHGPHIAHRRDQPNSL